MNQNESSFSVATNSAERSELTYPFAQINMNTNTKVEGEGVPLSFGRIKFDLFTNKSNKQGSKTPLL
jgi:hypothetical protein